MTIKSIQILAVASAAFAISAHAGWVDITVNDGSVLATGHADSTYGSGDPRSGIHESGETEWNTISSKDWDLRAFAYDAATNHLLVVSGFNPQTAQSGGGAPVNPLTGNNNIFIGDIFIDTINSFTLPSHGSNTFLTYANSGVGFEYAIDLTDPVGGSLGYRLVQLGSTSTLQSGGYAQNAHSDPANLVSLGNGVVLSSGNFSISTLTDSQVLGLGINVGTNGGPNYVYSFDLSAASLASGATFRLTETCGNDLLVGSLAPSVAAVPETSTWVMGFLAVGAVGFLARRSKKASV